MTAVAVKQRDFRGMCSHRERRRNSRREPSPKLRNRPGWRTPRRPVRLVGWRFVI